MYKRQALDIVLGILFLVNPLVSAGALAWFIGAFFIVFGVFEVVGAFKVRNMGCLLYTSERLLPGGSACRSRADGGQRAHGDGNDRRWGVRAAVRGVSDGFVSHGNGVDGWAHVRGRRHARVPVLVCDGSLPIEIGRVAGFGGYDGAFGFDRIVDDVRAGLHGWDGACLLYTSIQN